MKQLLEEHEREDKGDDEPSGPGSFPKRMDRDKQIKRIQRQAERIEKWLKENEAKIGTNGKEITSNITDNDCGQMITSHGFIQGYNGQALVDDKHQVVVHEEAFGPVFANIRAHKRMDHFTLRGKIKVDIQWLLYCVVHNIGKKATYGFT